LLAWAVVKKASLRVAVPEKAGTRENLTLEDNQKLGLAEGNVDRQSAVVEAVRAKLGPSAPLG